MNTMNMSDYQKIIFVNTIDESEIINDYPIDQLSSDYPFAVFFTENSNSTYNDLGYKVRNIWYKGDRLTRFVQTNNNFEINGHEFKLHFEYDNGLLSIVEANKLNNISLTHIQWIDAITETQMTLENNIDLNNIPTIYAKDNKFSLRLKFECDAAADLSKISFFIILPFIDSGTETFSSLQFLKASMPISTTLSGMITEVRLEQP